jgi:hypothetical protein
MNRRPSKRRRRTGQPSYREPPPLDAAILALLQPLWDTGQAALERADTRPSDRRYCPNGCGAWVKGKGVTQDNLEAVHARCAGQPEPPSHDDRLTLGQAAHLGSIGSRP